MIIKVPFGSGSLGKNEGCSKAPELIAEGKKSILVDAEKNNFKNTHNKIEEAVSGEENAVILGGDHSITYSSFKASGCDSLVILDAHPDVMAGTEMVSHEDFVSKLIEENSLLPENLVIIGLRNWDPSEMEFLKEKNISFVTMEKIRKDSFDSFIDELPLILKNMKKAYFSVDIDVADPEVAPGTGYPEKGGLSADETLILVRRIKEMLNPSFSDIVEINPEFDVDGKTISLGKQVLEILDR